MELSSTFFFFITLLLIGYYFVRKRYSYWADRGVPFYGDTFPLGCLKETGTKYHIAELLAIYYNELKNKVKFCGVYFFVNPVVVVLNLDFVKTILVRDFQYFVDRGMYFNEKDDPLSAHLFNIEGVKWKNLRAKLTPTFTSGKMKMMFPTIIGVADELKKNLAIFVENNPECEMKDIVARYTTDVIGTCGFGLNCNSLKDPNAKFRIMGKRAFTSSKMKRLKIFFMTGFTKFAHKLRMKSFDSEVTDFFMEAVKDTVDYREKNNYQGNDFMNLLMQLKNNGKLDGDTTSELVSLTIEEIAAQAFIFFLAGFETSSTTMSYSLYELSQYPDIQEKAREEIKRVLRKYDGKFTYEAALDMKYIDQIINETLRKYPPVANLSRRVTKDYNVPGTDHVFTKGMTVLVPIYAIQNDPDIYPNPELFNPDRFIDEEVKKRHPFSFIPFGEGPRVCIGLRFGMMMARIGLATLLMNFKFTTCSKTIIPLKFSAKEFILTPVSGLYLNVEKIDVNL